MVTHVVSPITCSMGIHVQVCYPKPTDKPLYNGLVKQIRCESGA